MLYELSKLPAYKINDLPSGGGIALQEQAKQIQILAVMIPGGPYVEDVERRLRSSAGGDRGSGSGRL